jgi:hypothetical protein
MPKIMFVCPTLDQPAWTGLTSDHVVFASLPNVAVPVDCPSCGEKHRWRPRHAWIEGHAEAGVGEIEPADATPPTQPLLPQDQV